MKTIVLHVLLATFLGDSPAQAQSASAKRRVYVLHGGIHTIFSDRNKNVAPETIRKGLIERGVPAKDVVVLDNPFPSASFQNMVPKECLTMFADSADPASKVSQECYAKLHKALTAAGVTPRDELIWVGHSAGGQMGMTMAALARSLARFPELARAAAPYHFDMVITLGSPIAANPLPADVKLRHYYSPEDRTVKLVHDYGALVLAGLGYRCGITAFPPRLPDNAKIRLFFGIEHPCWDSDARVLDCILSECQGQCRPAWAELPKGDWVVDGLRNLCRFLDEEWRLSLEPLPRAEK